MEGRLDVRAAHEVDAARVNDDEPGAGPQPLLQAGREHGMGVRRVGPDEQHDVGLLDGGEVLRAGRRPERLLQPEARRRMADPGAGVHIVRAEGRAHHLLDGEHLLVGAARRRDPADGSGTIAVLDGPQPGGGVRDRLLPADLAPGVGRLLAQERVEHAIGMGGVPPGEAALDAGMAFVGPAVLGRHHAHHLLALQLGPERATDAAVAAGGQHAATRLAQLDHRLLGERGRRADLDTGAARDALGAEER